MGYWKENLGANQVDLYKDLIETKIVGEDGRKDLMFKRLDDCVDPAEREFLEFVLDTINARRFPYESKEELEARKNNYDPEYYRVPLTKGHLDSRISAKKLTNLFKFKLSDWSPKAIF